jgi:Na+:H+ antiporter
LVEAESLFNDGTAAVAFAVIVSAAAGSSPSVSGITGILVRTLVGGVLSGAVVAGVTLCLAGRAKDKIVQFTLTLIAAYGSFLVAEHFQYSSVLASLTAGLIVGNLGLLRSRSDYDREAITAYWEFLTFLANSLLFIAIGIHESHQIFANALFPTVVAIVFVLLGRAGTVYPCCALFSRSRLRVPSKHQFVLFWGGLRGALALALVLGLPAWVANRGEIISVTFAVVAFSIFVQGLSMTPLLRRIGEIPPTESNRLAHPN